MSATQRNKGKRGERLWRDELRDAGFIGSYRGAQFCGTAGNADVESPEIPSAHFEVKFVEKLNLRAAFKQACDDANAKLRVPFVAHKTSREPWLVTMSAPTFFALLREGIDFLNNLQPCGGNASSNDSRQPTKSSN